MAAIASAAAASLGDCVEIFGLDAEDSKPLNGQTGIITGFSSGGAQVEVQLAAGGEANLTPSNIKRLEFQPVDCVEVFGLTSEEGRQINGNVGVIMRFVQETARYEVHFASGKRANFKPANLRKPGSGPRAEASPEKAATAEGEEEKPEAEEKKGAKKGAKTAAEKKANQKGKPEADKKAAPKRSAKTAMEKTEAEAPDTKTTMVKKTPEKAADKQQAAAKAGELEAKADLPVTPKPQRKRKAAEEEQPSKTDGDTSGVKRGRTRKSKDTASPAKDDEKAQPAEAEKPVVAESKEKPAAAAPQKRGGASKGKPTAAALAGLDEKVLAEAEALGMAGSLRNLAARDVIVAQAISCEAMLKALQQADGLVNKAKAILLGST